MSPNTVSEDMSLLSLLKSTIAPLRELTEYFTSIGVERAEGARKRLEKKGLGCGAFYSELLVDLTELGFNLDTLRNDVALEIDGAMRIHELLTVIERHFVKCSDGEREAYDYLYLASHEFPILNFVLGLLHDAGAKPEDDRRTGWLCEHIQLDFPTKTARKAVFPALARCQESIRKCMPSSTSDTDEPPGQGLEREWEEADAFYADLRRFHEDLNTCWTCDCHVPHRLAKFSFDYLPDSQDRSVECLLCYPHDKHDKSSYRWQPARMQYQCHEGSGSRMLDPSSAARCAPGTRKVLHQDRLHSTSETLCELLRNSQTGHFVQLVARNPNLVISRQARQDSLSYDSHRGLCEPTYLLEWLRHSSPMSFKKVPKRLRFALALRLSYDFLFLGGGPWWPYDRVSDDRASSVCFFDVEDAPEDAIQRPFFTSSLPDNTPSETVPYHLQRYNEYMPSLPVFGKLLLELVTGRYVDWDKLDRELKVYSSTKMCGTEIVHAVKTCLSMGNDKTFREGGLISKERRLRDHFLKEVVLTIQRVVRVGYQLAVKDVFSLPAGDRWSDTESSASRSTRRPSTSPSGLQARASPRRASTPNGPSPLSSQGLTHLETDLEGFCLHDGGSKETLQTEDAKIAADWMDLLKNCVNTVLPASEQHGRDTKTVKIAILDTGVFIPKDALIDYYDNRLIECRTWLDSWADEGKLVDANSDDDGHGTHGTSVLLAATGETGIKVYSAQVFRSRKEQVQRDLSLLNRSVWAVKKAIYHAVNEWKVDIISMSFGFPEAPPDIEEAIMYARNHNVLLLAAASNYGANKAVTWPANDERVMSIYATTGHGNRYHRNPTPGSGQNFATLGCSVLALWPPDEEDVPKWAHRSGTSTATPIAAGIAGLIMQVMETRKDAYLASQRMRGADMTRTTDKYQRQLDKLRTRSGMSAVFRLMVADEGMRDGYDYIAPWRLFKKEDTDHFMTQRILDAIRL